MQCPTQCSGSNSGRQNDLTDGQRKKLPDAVAAAADMRCSYCGTVYARSGKVFGTLDGGITGQGWKGR